MAVQLKEITVAHSPDSDDAFMFYALAKDKLDTFGLKINQVLKDIQSLNHDQLQCLVQTARKFLKANVSEESGSGIVTYTGFRRTTGRHNPAEKLWVYGRRGLPCRTCGTTIEAKKDKLDARVTFWCPNCQPMAG